jgi:rare lipoprotein A
VRQLRLRTGAARRSSASLVALAGCAHRDAPRPAATAPAPKSAAPAKAGSRYSQDQDSTPGGPPPDVSKILNRFRNPNRAPIREQVAVHCARRDLSGTAGGEWLRRTRHRLWYGNKFHGFTTSTFEKYDMYAYSAASKTLPLPSYARVTNLENGRSVIVRVNDRGPFVQNRVIDLSYVAAVKIGVWPKGTAMVEVRAIDPAHPEAEPAAPARCLSARARRAPEKTHKPALYLQVGAYGERANAERAAATVRAAHLGEVRIVTAQVNGKDVQRVRLGPLKDVDEADRLAPKVRDLGWVNRAWP